MERKKSKSHFRYQNLYSLSPICLCVYHQNISNLGANVSKLKMMSHKVTWNFDVGFPSVVVASSIKLHVSTEGIGEYREAIRDNFASRGYSKAWLFLMVFPEKGESYPWKMRDILLQVRLKELEGNHLHIHNSALTFWTTERRVTNAWVLVAPKVEKGTAVVPVQIYALVDHSLNNVWSRQKSRAGIAE